MHTGPLTRVSSTALVSATRIESIPKDPKRRHRLKRGLQERADACRHAHRAGCCAATAPPVRLGHMREICTRVCVCARARVCVEGDEWVGV